MRLRTVAVAATIACLASVAQAGAVFGSSASSTFSTPIGRNSGADADMNGAPDGTAAFFRNNTKGSGAQTFTVSWDVTGAESNIDWRLFVFNRTGAQTSLTGVQLTDDVGLNATSTNSMVLNTGPVAAGTITLFDLTEFQAQSDYGTVDSGFDWANVEGLLLTFTLNNPVGTGVRSGIRIDAISNPEPTTLAMFGLGLLGLGAAVRRRRRRFSATSNASS